MDKDKDIEMKDLTGNKNEKKEDEQKTKEQEMKEYIEKKSKKSKIYQ